MRLNQKNSSKEGTWEKREEEDLRVTFKNPYLNKFNSSAKVNSLSCFAVKLLVQWPGNQKLETMCMKVLRKPLKNITVLLLFLREKFPPLYFCVCLIWSLAMNTHGLTYLDLQKREIGDQELQNLESWIKGSGL